LTIYAEKFFNKSSKFSSPEANLMKKRDFLFTSESVTEGHPDKIADQISDAILDTIIAEDKNARVACETLLTTGLAFVAGEITTSCYADIPQIIRETIRDIGYTRAKYGFDYETCAVITSIHEQSSDIAVGVDPGGAGDQGLMFGYACNETPELMPMPIMLAHKLAMKLADVRKKDILPYLRPDGKTQVTIQYKNGRPYKIDTIVISSQHSPDITLREMKEDIIEKVIKPVAPKKLLDEENITYHINPTGRVTGVSVATAVDAFPGKILPRLTVQHLIWHGTSQKILLPQALLTRPRFNSPMPLEFLSLFLSSLIPLIRERLLIKSSKKQ
jgi:S-adenosylmethionine synthetase